ncbi:MAG: hypothetical protein OEY44_00585, partial [Candidatus Peregrinibacteria bacterium]|nr:hypothetical protein [Candidatus Peregrinibacteria bacterium]
AQQAQDFTGNQYGLLRQSLMAWRSAFHLDELSSVSLPAEATSHLIDPGKADLQSAKQPAEGLVLRPIHDPHGLRDLIIGLGEKLAAGLMAIRLRQEGIESELIDRVRIVGGKFNGEAVSVDRIHAESRKAIAERMTESREGVVRVLGGHIEGTPKGMAVSVGRSYTDTTAVNAAIALREMGEDLAHTTAWKDVQGAMSANPKDLRDPSKAVVHRDLSINEGLQMAGAGSELMQIDSLALAAEHNIDLSLRDIREPRQNRGTYYSHMDIQTGHAFKAIVANPNVDTVSISLPEMANRHGFYAAITQVFAKHEIEIGDIPSSSTSMTISIPLPKDQTDREVKRDAIRAALQELREVVVGDEKFRSGERRWRKGDLASLAVIGDELPNSTGILGEITSFLGAHGIDIKTITQDDFQRRIMILLSKEKYRQASQVLHRIFIEKDADFIAESRRRRDQISDLLVSRRAN